MEVKEKFERFITLDKEEKEILNKAVKVLCNIGCSAEHYDGNISLYHRNVTDPVNRLRKYTVRELFDFANLLSALAYKKKIDIVLE